MKRKNIQKPEETKGEWKLEAAWELENGQGRGKRAEKIQKQVVQVAFVRCFGQNSWMKRKNIQKTKEIRRNWKQEEEQKYPKGAKPG